ncbi:MAG TPA: MerR family DNA-binding transcriptional regulator, partial [Pirellulales bacterium]
MSRSPDLVSPRQLARALGVSESSLKRWCDQGLIESARTAGGHRRMAVGSAVRFARERNLTLAEPAILGLPDATRSAELAPEQAASKLAEALLVGDEALAVRIVVELYLAGRPLSLICDAMIAGAFGRIGERWEHRQADVYEERRAVEIMRRILFELRRLQPSPSDPWLAMGGTLEDDPYVLGAASAELVLREAGFRSQLLGTGIPLGSMTNAVRRHRPHLLWLSIAVIRDEERFFDQFARLAEACREHRSALVVG